MKKLFTLFTSAIVTLSALASNDPYLWVVGEGVYCGWDDKKSLAIREIGDHIYKGVFYINAGKDFKFMTINEWNNPEWGIKPGASMDENGVIQLATGVNDQGYGKFNLTESANYAVTIDLSDPDNATATIEKSDFQEMNIPAPTMFLIGDATPGGWATLEMVPMQQWLEKPWIFQTLSVDLKGVDTDPNATFKINIGGAQTYDDYFYYMSPKQVDEPQYEYEMGNGNSNDYKFKVPVTGNYTVTVDLHNNNTDLKKLVMTGVENILTDNNAENAPVEYFNLQGQRVAQPEHGIFIRRQGNTATKVVL